MQKRSQFHCGKLIQGRELMGDSSLIIAAPLVSSVVYCVQSDDVSSSRCYLFFYLDTILRGDSVLPQTLYWKLQLAVLKGLSQ